ncbi:MAG: class I SAM-dependent DNA methyltransferase [Hydrogenophaga sp.]|uniref:DNA methyltransferase n=1 Tax=Hydrogenophaga sp. TaxID=1904254 RepID=UPI001D23BC6B|nr:DNA methyltransferase [Hydrogenophaga sp.]MBX3610737.1 class I SAM-dependent DNA methyltransferase [Hydrogenophaga sp.]
MTKPNDKTAKLQTFKDWTTQHIKGDEKGEAQVFLDRLFQAFGWPGLKEAGANCELRVKNTTGGTSFADLVWKPVVVIEMKKRGADLSRHYSQAFTYWTRLVPNRPRFAVLCNFDEFWIYDFETQLDTPVDVVKLVDLPTRYGPLNFMFPGDVLPVFGNHQESVTRQAADKLAACFNSMTKRGVERPLAQRFTLQMLMALFSEDIGLLEKYLVTKVLDECTSPQDTHDLLGGLFAAMNTKGGVKGGRFKGVPYFNGGLFADPAHVELVEAERTLLKEAAKFDWSKVRPEIFGTLFEHSLGKEQRHATGAHFTSAVDIMKVVGPTIVEPWTRLIDSTTTLEGLRKLLVRIESFTVLDPACGSGNFLYIAYRELKRLEARIYERMAAEFKSVDPRQRPFGFVSTANFYGMDINPFAVDIAKVTMMLAHQLAIDELHINESALPLDNLDANFRAGDALINPDGSRTPWFKSDVIVGNPPFLGAKLMKPELGVDYVSAIRRAYPEVPGMADLCVYWFRRTHDELKACTTVDPVAGRAGLVGTQNVRNNASRIGGLDQIAATGTIVEAVDNQPWSGEANVHVSIVNWVKTEDTKLLSSPRRLWFKASPSAGARRRIRGTGSAAKHFELDMREVAYINSSLSDQVDVSRAAQLDVNDGYCYTGQYPRYNEGFVLSLGEGAAMRAAALVNKDVVHPFAGGDELLEDGSVRRCVIDFQARSILEAQAYVVPFKHVRTEVLPYVQSLAKKEREKTGKITGQDQGWLNTWWQHFRCRPELIGKIAPLSRYLVCSRVTKRPIFMFLSSKVRPSDALSCFALDDDYSFGVLQSRAHYMWFHAKCSNMKSDPRYTSESIFSTFPWPQDPSTADVQAVVDAARTLLNVRASAADAGTGLRALYRTLELPGKSPLKEAHAALNAAILRAYGFSNKRDLLQQLLDLNSDVAAKSSAGKAVTGPGVPKKAMNLTALVSADCFKPSWTD